MKKLFILGLITFCFIAAKAEAEKIFPVTFDNFGHDDFYITGDGFQCSLSDKPYFVKNGESSYINLIDTQDDMVNWILTFGILGNLHLDNSSGCFLIASTESDIAGEYKGYFLTIADKTASALAKNDDSKKIINFVCLGATSYSKPTKYDVGGDESWWNAQIEGFFASVAATLAHPLPTFGPLTLNCGSRL